MRVLAFLFFFPFTTVFTQEIPDYCNTMLMKINEQPSKKTDKELARMRKKNPNDPWVYWMSGINVSSRSVDEEIVYYQKAIAVDSCFARAYYNWATVLPATSAEEQQKILSLLVKTTACNPDFGYAYIAKGEIFLIQKNYVDALTAAKNAQNCQQTNLVSAQYIELKALHGLNDKNALHTRLKETNLVNELGFWSPEISLFLGNVYSEMNEPANACLCWNHALEMTNTFGEEPSEELSESLKKCP